MLLPHSPPEPPTTVENTSEADWDCVVSNLATNALPGELLAMPVVVGNPEDEHPVMYTLPVESNVALVA
jgi:hypothetical protein